MLTKVISKMIYSTFSNDKGTKTKNKGNSLPPTHPFKRIAKDIFLEIGKDIFVQGF